MNKSHKLYSHQFSHSLCGDTNAYLGELLGGREEKIALKSR